MGIVEIIRVVEYLGEKSDDAFVKKILRTVWSELVKESVRKDRVSVK